MKVSLKDSVSGILNQMHGKQSVAKGSYGENSVFKICEDFYQSCGGILIHSYEYAVDKELAGNIKRQDYGNSFYVENLGSTTEIDVMYISKYRVFPIEVKAYRANEITFTDDKIDGCYKVNKSPVHQNEMHCRHLYSHIYRALPKGGTTRPVHTPYGDLATEYIVPIVCMVDKADILDGRSDWQREYIKLTILDQLHELISFYNTPLDYQIDLDLMDKVLKEDMTQSSTYLPVRK